MKLIELLSLNSLNLSLASKELKKKKGLFIFFSVSVKIRSQNMQKGLLARVPQV